MFGMRDDVYDDGIKTGIYPVVEDLQIGNPYVVKTRFGVDAGVLVEVDEVSLVLKGNFETRLPRNPRGGIEIYDISAEIQNPFCFDYNASAS